MDGRAADNRLHGELLFHRVRGHNGVGRRVAGGVAALEKAVQLRHALLDDPHLQRLADDAGGGHQHLLAGTADGLGGGGAHPLRVLLPLGGAGVGVSAVGDDGPDLAVGQVGLCHVDGGRLHHVFGEHGRRPAGHVGDNEGHVLLPRGMGLDPHMEPRRPKAKSGAHAAGNCCTHGQFSSNFGIHPFSCQAEPRLPAAVTPSARSPRGGPA